ncbi:bifunctional alpha,alpha-trehalose-phosphate synthase (UDP-forming)/trehalose-phosphatase [Marinilongibacter aquaticus]|uniref:bifunctional alpha,alpha-trehalose-phosphate synthase (UDP-forming)/trehalose-phosphatase n=1 Tax=Marinilongibacter aquaticus TaxID=2975157 RepID=UPI0021BDCAF0|nr:bifunctional alpha,alpha-trehalose-phosphate synthase (UDP-forming)/trehalose-phosphatase [Marinilongibacter aquaticus]UBM58373.1 bifunctional alpha,alpha-trehalose-phosphate synthase (UDP-forming)/trehalose-phosphatase [Marinilongibacter aquaticus]
MSKGKRLLIVSNRLPYQLENTEGEFRFHMSSGGLVSALKSYMESSGGSYSQMLWFGNADFNAKEWKAAAEQQPEKASGIKPIFIPKTLKEKHYSGFSNSTLWPHFHYFPTFTKYDHEDFKAYHKVNELFAKSIVAEYQEGDVIWVHDYQLLLLPQMLRRKLPNATIGFFLHIPFPSFEIFRMLPREWREQILQGMLGADLVGFHTNDYVLHFQKSVRMLLGYESKRRIIQTEDRPIRSDLFPISIDYHLFNKSYDKPEVRKIRREMKNLMPGVKTIFSVDRLDYTKGIPNRLIGFERFLEQNPEWHEKVTFNLVVVPSRDVIKRYSENKRRLDELVGKINGRFGKMGWQPVVYQYRSLDFDELCASYTGCDVALITPVRDGMNLVSKEFLASRKDQKGVLILSEMAGSAAELGEAILINPTDLDEIATGIKRALTLPIMVQSRNMEIMQERIRTYDVQMWAHDFMTQLNQIKTLQENRKIREVGPQVKTEIQNAYANAKKRMFFLDYDGTLMPFQQQPHMARPNERVLHVLENLTADPKNIVTVISGRDKGTLSEWLGHLPINLVTEHGAAKRLKGEDWKMTEKIFNPEWRQEIHHQMKLVTHRCAKSFIEEKSFALAWHYRNADKDLGFLRSRELIDSLYRVINNNMPLQVIDGNKVVEVRMTGVDKGSAALELYETHRADFVLTIGDDRTDEDMFRALNSVAYTIKVGTENTEAKYYFTHIAEVLPFFENLIN